MYPKEENVNAIIEQMDHLSSSEKIHISAVYESLMRRQETLFNNIKDEVKKEIASNTRETLDIYVALVGSEMKKVIREYNFYEVCPDINTIIEDKVEIKNKVISRDESYSCGIVFWNANYDLISDAISKNYKASLVVNGENYDVEYSLRSIDAFVKKEKDIHKISMQYGIETPLIYNPMARRALEVWVKIPCDINKSDTAIINLNFDQNELSGQILLDSYLVWNISEKSSDELPPVKTGDFTDIVPLWDKTFLVYRFSAKNKNENIKDYILVNNDVRVIKRVGNDIYWQLNNDYSEMTYKKYSICSINDAIEKKMESQSRYLFHNDYDIPSTGEIERIRTKADAMRGISCFKQLGITCSDIWVSRELNNKEVIYTYTKRLDYYQLKDERLRTMHSCIICFDDNREDLFFTDKVSYVLGYMNHRYPEYQWIGVC